MIRIVLSRLGAQRGRLLLTVVAVVLGVGFISGTFALGDLMRAGYAREFAASAEKVDVAVLPAEQGETLPAGLLKKIRALPGVTDARGLVRDEAPLLGRDGRTHGHVPTQGFSLPTDGPLQRYTVLEGRVPAAPDEAVLNESLAEDTGFRPGERIQVLDPKERRHTFRLVGIVDVGIDAELTVRGGVGFLEETAVRMTGQKDHVEIDVAGTVTPAQVRAAIGGAGHEVITGKELASRLSAAAGVDIQMITTGLLAFGLISLLVAGLVIANTFTILVAQRARELALLRCLGATRRQVFGAVVVEAALVGLVGSLAGLAAGLGLAVGGAAAVNAMGMDVPAEVSLSLRTVAVALSVGLVMTVLSALPPAFRATKVAPLAALRTEPEPGERSFRLGRARWALAVPSAAGGLALTVVGMRMEPGETAMFTVAGGGALTFLAVIAVMPLLVRAFGLPTGGRLGGLLGLPGRLAVQNVRRTPRRTAATTVALTVGVGLMSLFAVVGASSKATADQKMFEQFPIDYRLHTGVTGRTIPRGVADELRRRNDLFSVVTSIRSVETKFGANERAVASMTQSSLGVVARPEMKHGSLADLRQGTVLISEGFAARDGIAMGDEVPLETERGVVRVTVSAVYSGDAGMIPDILIPEADFARNFGQMDDADVYVNLREDVPVAEANAVIDAAVRDHPRVQVATGAAMKAEFAKAIDMLIGIFAGLLGLAIVIALFGIVNTLTLSVVERTRESALLRALGVSRRQLRGMLSAEAVIMSLLGAGVGVVLGTVFGWAATRSLFTDFVFAVPYGQILLYLGLAVVAGLLAAVLPARRAARASIVESLSAD
ncbi:ABC transporter permease [Actinocorallia populi]|uniref:ABC transporter permease n=1 Tax=Actinocorallia populi TaxID=2079200 RepID=UPI000D08946D|nr:FtsX-like permease family protein [Actinocorallia populi]